MGTDVIVLAAGLGRRFNDNKLMHLLDGKPIVGYCLDLCAGMLCNKLVNSVTVVASNETVIAYTTANYPDFRIVANSNPAEGISSSLKMGIRAAKATNPASDGFLILLGDMPYLNENHIGNLLNKIKESETEIAVSHEIGSADDDFRNPVVISSKFYEDLLLLQGDCGAKSLVKKQFSIAPCTIGIVDTKPQTLHDIDTKDDIR